MYQFERSEKLKKILKKVYKKDRQRYEAVIKKIFEIINCKDADHYKNLSNDMKGFKRVHIDSHFVLTFKVEKEKNNIKFEDLDHHDNIYGQKKKG